MSDRTRKRAKRARKDKKTKKALLREKSASQREAGKVVPTSLASPQEADYETAKEADVPRISTSDRIAKLKKDLEV